MGRIKTLNVGVLLLAVLVLMTLILSCSHTSSTLSPILQGKSELTSSPTTNEIQPTILTYKDLSVLADGDPATIDNSKFPITPVEYLGITGNPPEVNTATYTLLVDGLVDTPLALSYDSLLEYPAVSETVLLICPGVFVNNAEWTGIAMKSLLTEAGIKSDASEVVFHAMDGYLLTFPLQEVRKDGVFLAYAVNGQVLPKEHGFPIRLVMKGKYGSDWEKWVNRVEIK
jgi:DMSO/TMAO reductase YedYZ molybdopterin-dependent catalytic subunit